MTKAIAIIGACFGDEGKGLMVDYFAKKNPCSLIVRYNGGSQSGHTTQDPFSQTRHVHHHFGSGTWAGADTYLSRYFITNPFIWWEEYHKLSNLGLRNRIWIDFDAMLTLPHDMLLNRAAEQYRGDKRHGSVGIGINETTNRCRLDRFKTRAADLWRPEFLRRTYDDITSEWLPRRAVELDLEPSVIAKIASDLEDLRNGYFEACGNMSQCTILTDIGRVKTVDTIIFEGAQGLLLDEHHKFHPHVTPSKTGLPNILEIARQTGIDEIEVVYVMRSYMTRHGAGPFPSEIPGLSFEDETNYSHEWQGSLRFGAVDLDLIPEAIRTDLACAESSKIKITRSLAITHLDQTFDNVAYQTSGTMRKVAWAEFVDILQRDIAFSSIYCARGPTRNDVTGPYGLSYEGQNLLVTLTT